MTHMEIQDYVNKGYFGPGSAITFDLLAMRWCHGRNLIAGMDFLLEDFISEVLRCIKIQVHQFT